MSLPTCYLCYYSVHAHIRPNRPEAGPLADGPVTGGAGGIAGKTAQAIDFFGV